MPRGSAGSSSSSGSGKRQAGGTSNGFVTPKRPSRSRSSTNSSLPVTPIPPPVPSTANSVSTGVKLAETQFVTSWSGSNKQQQPQNRWWDDDTESGHLNGESLHRQIDVKTAAGSGGVGAGVNAATTSAGAMGSAATVLASFPLLDTITLLIIFLQLPSTVLTVIHFLYALQTFVPPTTTLLSASTPSSIPSFSSLMLQGSNGSPSLLTILFADIVVALISMFLWPSARTFLIDFAQAVIAISFGAGTESGGGTKNAAVCAGLMSGIKVMQGRLDFPDVAILDSIHPGGSGSSGPSSSSSAAANKVSKWFSGRGQSDSWTRNAIAIHIVAQWGMQLLRRWLIKLPDAGVGADPKGDVLPSSNGPSSTTGKAKDKDPEAAAGAPPLERENSIAGSGKRRKKIQAQSIRNKQPMWATIANMVVHLAKEIERSRATSEAHQGAGALTGGTGAGSAAVKSGTEQVWITRIGSNDVGFVANSVGLDAVSANSGKNSTTSGIPGVEITSTTATTMAAGKRETNPFFVRVNGILWPQTDIFRVTSTSEEDGQDQTSSAGPESEPEWVVEVTGLAGSTEYDFEFVHATSGRIFFTTSACTAPAAQASSTTPAPPAPQPSRPLSPITTLLHSLAQARSCLSDTRSTLKATRKSHKAALSDLRRDIEKHRSLLVSNDRGEERAFRRNLALRENIKRAEEEASAMEKTLAELEKEPERLRPIWEQKKREWQKERDTLKKAMEKVRAEKTEADAKASGIEAEMTALAAKRDKLVAKVAKLKDEEGNLEKEIETARSKGAVEERERERHESAMRRSNMEKQFEDAIREWERKIEELEGATKENWAMVFREGAAPVGMGSAAVHLEEPFAFHNQVEHQHPMLPHLVHHHHHHQQNQHQLQLQHQLQMGI